MHWNSSVLPSEETTLYSFNTNGIKNSPLSECDAFTCIEMLGLSNYEAQNKTIIKHSDEEDINLQRMDIRRSIENNLVNLSSYPM